MTRCHLFCDICGTEIAPTAPRYKLETRMVTVSVTLDVCSPRCLIAVGTKHTEHPPVDIASGLPSAAGPKAATRHTKG